ncbi:unnamed protein product [Cladocopium goreaui]|uniref:Uncharacterized protein n=1 Tax=Cladocopium goreaui TaxID=2562237 RepID=A0A9P1CK55_9DINO|nr:unnamed protein product [Cladocopium goreaui]
MQLRLELRVQEASKDGHALNFAFSGIPVGSRWTLGAGQERLAQEVQRALEVGQCAVDLSNAFLLLDLDKLERLYSKAKAQSSAGSELKFDLQVSC